MDDYFARLTSMADELREAGVIIEDDELSLIALTGLDDSYKSFVTSHTAQVDEIDFSALLGLLRSYEGCLCRLAQLKGVATANIAQSSLSVKPVQSSSGVIIYQVCKKNGHDALVRFNHHNEQWFPSTQSKTPTRYRSNRGKRSNTANAVWYPDSGASDYVT